MAFDAFYLTAVLGEVRERCDGATVEKIYQPSRDTLIFQLRGQKSREKLLLCPKGGLAHIFEQLGQRRQ